MTAHAYGVQQRSDGELSPVADGFTTFGVRFYRPEDRRWLEVSVRGRPFASRRMPTQPPTMPVVTDLGNQLTDGTIIDLGGVCLLYRSPAAMAKAPEVYIYFLHFFCTCRSHHIAFCRLTQPVLWNS